MAGSIVYLAAKHIESKIQEGSKSIVKVKPEANALLLELKNVQKPVVDAEGKTELTTSSEVCCWIKEAVKIAHEAEDEVDTLITTKSSHLSFLRLGNGGSKRLRMLKERAKEVKSKLDELAQGCDNKVMCHTPKVHHPDNDDLVIGIDHEIKTVVDQLTGQSKSSEGQTLVNRLAIVGMGGSGKTTLARSIYSHKGVKKHFHFQAWVSLSAGLDILPILNDVLKQLQVQDKKWFSPSPRSRGQIEYNSDELLSQLNKFLDKKTCLLVLDDVWDLQSLHNFIAFIEGNDSASRTYTIVITSRLSPRDHNNWCIYQKQYCLTNEDSMKLLKMVASNSSKAIGADYPSTVTELLRKCQGLPLAILVLGRKLKDDVHYWDNVSSQIGSEEGTTSIYSRVNEILGRSYDQLPNYLNPCFLYLCMFPDGSAISGGRLIKMWIAEGLIETGSEETLEVAGRRYLKELIDHNMVQVVEKTYSGKPKTIQIHDIMRDFSIAKARDLGFLGVSSSVPEALRKTCRREAINLCKSNLPANNSRLRTLALFNKSSTSAVPERYTSQANKSNINMANVCKMFKLLRVLDMFGINSSNGTLPREIGDLTHLTYLRIRSTNIRELPKSIGKLLNLLTLDYWDVSTDTELHVPNVLWKLKRLRHLYLPSEMNGTVEDLKLDTLNDLITLWGVRGEHWMRKKMDGLSSTLSKLYIHHISTEDQLEAVLSCPAIEKNSCLYALALEWYSFDLKSLEKLLAKQNLQKLRLSGKATEMSHPQGLGFPSNLGKLELFYTQLEKPETMLRLGELRFLKILRLSKNAYAGSEWICAKQAFPKLEELKLDNLPKLEIWVMEEGAMPCLKTLSIVSCVNLKKMPEGLKLVQSLEKLDIEHMPCNFRCRLEKVKESGYGEGEDFHIIKHIAQVNVRGSVTPLIL